MTEVKDVKINVITFDGYKFACFPNTKDSKKSIEEVKNLKVDGIILSTPLDENLGHTLHIVAIKNVNCKRLASLLVEEGKKNDLYWKHNGIQSEKSARVHSANLNLLVNGN